MTIVTENVLVPTGGFQNTSFVVTLVMRGCKIKKLCLPFFILVEDITIPYVKVQGKDSVSIPCLLNKTRGGEGGGGMAEIEGHVSQLLTYRPTLPQKKIF